MNNTCQTIFVKNLVSHRDWDLVHRFGQMGPKLVFGHNLAIACQTFTNNPLFYSEFFDQYLTTF